MAKFSWCMESKHSDCRVRFQKWYIGNKRVKRKTVEAIIFLEEWWECECKCHRPKEEKKPKKRATRRKK